jgi:quercetin 2,3-dioxygenase
MKTFEGHQGTIEACDLQWMTAGRGIVHSELPAAHGAQTGLQLWKEGQQRTSFFFFYY